MNSNNSNNKLNTLFYKVFKNKILFKKIYEHSKDESKYLIGYQNYNTVGILIEYGLIGILKEKVRLGEYVSLNFNYDWARLFKAIKDDIVFYRNLFSNYPEYNVGTQENIYEKLLGEMIEYDCIGAFKALLEYDQFKEYLNNNSSMLLDQIEMSVGKDWSIVQYLFESSPQVVKFNFNSLISWKKLIRYDSTISSLKIINYLLGRQLLSFDSLNYISNLIISIYLYELELSFKRTTPLDLITFCKLLLLSINGKGRGSSIGSNQLFEDYDLVIGGSGDSNEFRYTLKELESLSLTELQLNSTLLDKVNYENKESKDIIKNLIIMVRSVNKISGLSLINFKIFYDDDDIKSITDHFDIDQSKYIFKNASFKLFKSLKQIKIDIKYCKGLLFKNCKSNKERQVHFIDSIIHEYSSFPTSKVSLPPEYLFYLLLGHGNVEYLIKYGDMLYDLVIGPVDVQLLAECIDSIKVLEYIISESKWSSYFKCCNLDGCRGGISIGGESIKPLLFTSPVLVNYIKSKDQNGIFISRINSIHFKSSDLLIKNNGDLLWEGQFDRKCFNYRADEINGAYLLLFSSPDYKSIVKHSIFFGKVQVVLKIINVLTRMKAGHGYLDYKSSGHLLDIITTIVDMGSISTLELILDHHPNILKEVESGSENSYLFQDQLDDCLFISVISDLLKMTQYLSQHIKITNSLKESLLQTRMGYNLSYSYIINQINQIEQMEH